jgi:hypothetical protein
MKNTSILDQGLHIQEQTTDPSPRGAIGGAASPTDWALCQPNGRFPNGIGASLTVKKSGSCMDLNTFSKLFFK